MSVNAGFVLQQGLDGSKPAEGSGGMQRCFATGGWLVDIGSLVEQQVDHCFAIPRRPILILV